MGKQDVRDALVAMEEDESIRAGVAEGDFSGLGGLDLSDDEQLLVRDAASDMPDVAGFASDIFAKIGDIKGESTTAVKLDKISLSLGDFSQKWNVAWKYGARDI